MDAEFSDAEMAALYAAIAGVYARSYRALERGDVDAYLREFTEDCTVAMGGHEVVGRAALGQIRRQHPATGFRHYVTNHDVQFLGDKSSAMATAAVLVLNTKEMTIVSSHVYRTHFRKRDGRWLIERHGRLEE